jgi:hypothetical protein
MSGQTSDSTACRGRLARPKCILTLTALASAPAAHASLFSGDTLDLVANVIAWIVLFIAPAIAIGVFWMVHILPERIAEQRHHPQAPAIKTLCLLSLFFGGLLWPLAWLWAYSKPVLHKIAYGTDTVVPEHHAAQLAQQDDAAPIASELEPAEHQEGEHIDDEPQPPSPPRARRPLHAAH